MFMKNCKRSSLCNIFGVDIKIYQSLPGAKPFFTHCVQTLVCYLKRSSVTLARSLKQVHRDGNSVNFQSANLQNNEKFPDLRTDKDSI